MNAPLPLLALAAAALVLCVPRRARAIDPFEIQVYDGTANEPGVFSLELHLNHVLSGLATAPPPELPSNGVTHFTLEPGFGVTRFWEIGGYFETALGPDRVFHYAGVKLRSKFVVPEGVLGAFRLGLNIEFSALPQIYDRGRYAMELRPIAAYANDVVALVINPIVDASLAGPDAPAGPTFEPCASAKLTLARNLSFGVEYYGSIGPIAHPLAGSAQPHYLYEVFDLLNVHRLEVDLGVGEGLTAASDPLTIKLILGYEITEPWASARNAR